ncbi:hypothetical protein BC628DRAFT_171397 [Trametes gibbosa]|nr:hypothetical protein BC628DRAFT_171397 [Trametes gibbosa]
MIGPVGRRPRQAPRKFIPCCCSNTPRTPTDLEFMTPCVTRVELGSPPAHGLSTPWGSILNIHCSILEFAQRAQKDSSDAHACIATDKCVQPECPRDRGCQRVATYRQGRRVGNGRSTLRRLKRGPPTMVGRGRLSGRKIWVASRAYLSGNLYVGSSGQKNVRK